MRRGRSLRLNLMAWLAVPVAVVLLASAWLSWTSAWHQAMRIMERDLTASARMIAEEIRYRNGTIGVVVPPAALEIFASDSHDEVAYAVFNDHGVLIAGFPGLEPPPLSPGEVNPKSFDTMFRTEAMHGVTLDQPVIVPNGTVTASVTVGETLKARNALVQSLWVRGFLEQAALVLAAALSIWVGINIELRPLIRLRRAVLDRAPQSVEPFEEGDVQQELRPLVRALNAHMVRLTAYVERQQRFLDAAAHQMRTALAVLKTQVGVARRETDDAAEGGVLGRVDDGLTLIGRVSEQLLTLGRVEHERVRPAADRVELRDIAREVVSDLAPKALDAGVELALEAETSCAVAANAMLVREIFVNLVDNAIRYAGAGAVATVSVSAEQGDGVISVSDTGRGVDETGRAKLLRRFERSGRAGSGSGLGLTIVVEIAEMFGGEVQLGPEPGEPGFRVRVRLPGWREGG